MAELKPAIEISGLGKRYGHSDKFALNKVSIKVMPGEVYGFLGPNGAGKSTTIRLLMNFIQPTSGSAQILGMDVVRQSVDIKRRVGYLSGDIALYSKMTGRQFLDYMGELQPPQNLKYVNALAERFQANLNVKIRDLSKGNRQKIGLLQAFMHKPKVLILDEPTSGLDPLMQEQFFELLKESTKAGGCVFVSSHNLSEVQKMCGRIGFIREGELIMEQALDEVAELAARTFDITFSGPAPKAELKAIAASQVKPVSTNQVTISLRGNLSPLFKVLARHNVAAINQREVNLEEEFLSFYKKGQP
jgi:ABC-2 type transport system ATP-binding protein